MVNLDELFSLLKKYLESQVYTDWWSDYIKWLIPVAISLLAIWLSFRNTKKQNAENHRPYLTIKDLKLIKKGIKQYIIYAYKDNQHTSPTPYEIHCILTLKNIGYGVASTVKLMRIINKINVNEVWDNLSKEPNPRRLTIIDIASNDSDIFYLSIFADPNKDEIEDSGLCVPLILLYSDLYGNVYSSIIIININKIEDSISYKFYPMQTAQYRYVLNNSHVSHKTLKNRYIYNTRKRKK